MFSKVTIKGFLVLLHFQLSKTESYGKLFKDLKRHNFNYISQLITGKEVKLLIYPQFRATKICQ